jgi:hypothetical protein
LWNLCTWVLWPLATTSIWQLIPMWKNKSHNWFQQLFKRLFIMITYLNSPFHEDTLKDQLWNALKDLKIGNSNEEGIKETILQFNEILTRFKAMKVHATKNMFKRRQDFIDGTPGGCSHNKRGHLHQKLSDFQGLNYTCKILIL